MTVDPFIGRYGDWSTRFQADMQAVLDELSDLQRTTELCGIMKKQGSDKGDGRHNYTKAYHALFIARRNDPIRIFEVGLGTNNEDVLSSMGPSGIPGASLRGWREFFPNAIIHGGDIDKRILFQENRIKTHFVDQLSKEVIRGLWEELGAIKFDLILDDGLHTFDANATFAANSFHMIAPGGFLIIEDIINHAGNLMLFDAFLRGFRKEAALIKLPHLTNEADNIIAVIAA